MRLTVAHARLELLHTLHAPRPTPHAPLDISTCLIVNIVMPGNAEHIADPERGPVRESVPLGRPRVDYCPSGY